MSYDTIESSLEDARPIRGYQFTLGSTIWRYTSAEKDFTDSDGNVWEAVPISDDGIKQTGEATTDALTITAPFRIGPVQVHLGALPAEAIQVTIHRTHIGDADDQMVVTYSGEIRQVNTAVVGQAKIICETTGASIQREGLRLGWQRSCPYALYDPLTCKADKSAHAVALRVLLVDGFVVTVDNASAYADGHFSGGFVEWEHPVRGMEYRGIETHAGNTLTIFGMTDDIYEGLVLTAYPGCARNTSTCSGKFNNLENYGGIPHLPGKSPFDGTPVF